MAYPADKGEGFARGAPARLTAPSQAVLGIPVATSTASGTVATADEENTV